MILGSDFLMELVDASLPGHAAALRFLRDRPKDLFFVTVGTLKDFTSAFGAELMKRLLPGVLVLKMHREVAIEAAAIDREGDKLGPDEIDLAAFCRFYDLPLVSRERIFDQVKGLQREDY